MTNSKNKSTKAAEKVIRDRKRAAELAERSETPNVQGQTETVTIRENTPDEYKLTFRFPGVAQGWRVLESNTKDDSGSLVGPAVMENALSAGIVIAPRITSIDFWNEHKGFYEACAALVQFLTERLN